MVQVEYDCASTPRSRGVPKPPNAKILLVDDDPQVVGGLARLLGERGHRVHTIAEGSRALAEVRRGEVDLVLLDTSHPDRAYADLIEELAELPEAPTLILLTAFGTITEAVEAMRKGAYDYIQKPLVEEKFLLIVDKALEQRGLRKRCSDLENQLGMRFQFNNLIGKDPAMRRIFQIVETISDTRATVLISGESGTGKTMLARAIHHNSDRRSEAFVEVNCGALPESLLESELFGHTKGAFTGAIRDKPGKFELADRGTIFLDEIATAPPALQVKLLRVVQDRVFERVGGETSQTVDVRMILASNLDLEQEVRAGRFREDLFYRINVVSLELPPLRERIADIPALAESFLERYAAENNRAIRGFNRECMDRLLNYGWPGNVRELENAVERAVVLCRKRLITIDELPPALLRDKGPGDMDGEDFPLLPLKQALEEPERRIIERALLANNGNRKKTAAMLDVNRTTLFNKMKKYGLLGRF